MSTSNETNNPIWRQIVGPGWLDLALLIVGIVAGVLLGPIVLGKAAPDNYQAWFVGGADEQVIIDNYLEEREAEKQRLLKTGSDSVLDVFEPETEAQLRIYEGKRALAQLEHESVYRSRMTAILLAVVGLMLLEVFMVTGASNMVDAVRFSGKVATARYALVAVWLAMLLAVPSQLRELPIVFTILILVVAAAVAFAPLRGKPASDSQA